MDNCFGCGKSGYKVRYCPNIKEQYKEIGQASGSNDSPKKNHFYALRSRGEQQTFPDMVNGIFIVLSIDVYVLLERDATFYFVNLWLKSLTFYLVP